MNFKDVKMMNDLDILDIMIIKINKYFSNTIFIGDLIYDLENLFNKLETIPKEWEETFFNMWIDIEVAYSLTLYQGLELPVGKEKEIIESSLNFLKDIVTKKIEELRKFNVVQNENPI